MSEAGTLINKATLLKDATAALFGLGTDAVPDNVLAKLAEAAFVEDGALTDIDGNIVGVQIATGSYVGTGTYGASNPNTLTFDFEPKLVVISQNSPANYVQKFGIFISSANKGVSMASNTSDPIYVIVTSWNESSVSWYTFSESSQQLNDTDYPYGYIAIG